MIKKGMIQKSLLSLVLLLAFIPSLQAALISRTITIDGDMAEWFVAPEIPTNPGQFSFDCEGSDPCDLDFPVGSTGRDLETFSYTWDDNYLYFYVTRYASSTNTTDWLFYLDENANTFMESTERIFRVQWSGSNRKTNAYLCPYNPDDVVNGDPISNGGVGDGYSLPGGSDNAGCVSLYSNVVAGSLDGVQMESRLAWADMGMAGPQNIRFHISSSTGVNLPTQIIDNMDGPNGGGGQFFPSDMSVEATASSAQVLSKQTLTLDITLSNLMYDDFTDVEVTLNLPPELSYQSHTAPVGTTFNSPYTLWQVPLLQAQEVLVLQVTVLAQNVLAPTDVTVNSALQSWVGDDSDATNNSSNVNVQILPVPELSVTKSASIPMPAPGSEVVYESLVVNVSNQNATTVVVSEQVGDFSSFKLGSTVFTDAPMPYVSSELTLSSTEYHDGNNWAYVPVTGGGGAPAGYDANVQQIRFTFTGNMPPNGGFTVEYTTIIQ